MRGTSMLRPLLAAFGPILFGSGALCANVARAGLSCQGTKALRLHPHRSHRSLCSRSSLGCDLYVIPIQLSSLKPPFLAVGCLQIADALATELEPPPSAPANDLVGVVG